MFSLENLPLIFIFGLCATAWLLLFSVILA